MEINLWVLIDGGRILYTHMYKESLERYLPMYPDSKIVELKGEL